jgi:hypothetical protein
LGTLVYTVQNYSDSQSLLSDVNKLQKSLDLFLPLLVLAFLCLVGEGWLANQPPRKAREPGEEKPKEDSNQSEPTSMIAGELRRLVLSGRKMGAAIRQRLPKRHEP